MNPPHVSPAMPPYAEICIDNTAIKMHSIESNHFQMANFILKLAPSVCLSVLIFFLNPGL